MKCSILGASGLIGQQFVRLLANHPFFKIEEIYASDRSAGKSMKEIWGLPSFECPESVEDLELNPLSNLKLDSDLVFSGLPASVAVEVENKLRDNGIAVFSNASAHRMDDDVPILIPEG